MNINSSNKKLLKSTSIYFVGKVLSKIITFFMLPLYTIKINAADMGNFDSNVALITFFVSVIFIDLQSGMLRYMLEKNGEFDSANVVTTGIVISVISMVLYSGSMLVLGFTITVEYFWLIVGYGVIMSMDSFWGAIARGDQRNKQFAIYGIIVSAFTVLLNLLFLLVFKWDYKSLYLAAIISGLIGIVYLEIYCKTFKRIKKANFNKTLFKLLIRYCLPLCVNSMAFWFLSSVNRVFVKEFLGAEANGYLAIANKFNQILYLVSTCFQFAWQEHAYSRDASDKKAEGCYYSKAFSVFTILVLICTALLIPFVKVGLHIFPGFIDASYSDALILIPLALAGCSMSILSSFLSSIIGAFKKNSYTFVSTLIGAIVNVVVIILLIKPMGVMAANIAFLLGFTMCVVFKMIFIRKMIGFRTNYLYVIIGIALVALSVILYSYSSWYFSFITIAISSIVAIVLFRREIKNIWDFIKKKLSKKHSE